MPNMDQGFLFNIQRMSTEDGPGIRTTVFMKQCNLKCVWCHNPESILKKSQLEWFKHKCIGCNTCIDKCSRNCLSFSENGLVIDRIGCDLCGECVDECPSTALKMIGKWWNVEDLFSEVNKDKIYYSESKGGITVSGGEPTLQAGFLLPFLKKCKENGISTALDTCGYNKRDVYAKLLPFIDLVLFDIKIIDNNKHKDFTGLSNDRILENAVWISEYLQNENKKMWIRTPLIPNYTSTEKNIKEIGMFIVNKLKNIPERWDLLAFNNLCISKYERLGLDWRLKEEPLLTKDEIEDLFEIGKKTGVRKVNWSGLTRTTKDK
ncbi:MAG: glycyl-radical enzyme activating protein [Promethearchaeota archaeon]|jgi:pyruvate formate lyase activating enzyme